jgi:hypothetical protein
MIKRIVGIISSLTNCPGLGFVHCGKNKMPSVSNVSDGVQDCGGPVVETGLQANSAIKMSGFTGQARDGAAVILPRGGQRQFSNAAQVLLEFLDINSSDRVFHVNLRCVWFYLSARLRGALVPRGPFATLMPCSRF